MRYLITGSTGVVGKYIVKQLIRSAGKDDQIVAISRKNRYRYDEHPGRESALYLDCYADLSLDCTRLITQYKPSHVLHCAGNGVQNSDTRSLWKANVDTTFNLLHACTLLTTPVKFIYCSSIVVDNKPLNTYAASKLTAEKLVESYTDSYEYIDGKSIRFCAVAGAGNRHGVVKDVVAKLLDKNQEKLSLLSNSCKPILYAGHLAYHIVSITRIGSNKLYYISPTDNISVADISRIACEATGINKEIVFAGKDDQNILTTYNDCYVGSSAENVLLAIGDILREDYSYVR